MGLPLPCRRTRSCLHNQSISWGRSLLLMGSMAVAGHYFPIRISETSTTTYRNTKRNCRCLERGGGNGSEPRYSQRRSGKKYRVLPWIDASSMMHWKEHDAQELVPNLRRAAHHADASMHNAVVTSRRRCCRARRWLLKRPHLFKVSVPTKPKQPLASYLDTCRTPTIS